jgi:hypothetical protein
VLIDQHRRIAMFLRRWIASFPWLVLAPFVPLVAQGTAPADTGMHRVGDTWTFNYQNADLTQLLRALLDAIGVTARMNNMAAGKKITLQESSVQTSDLYACIRGLAILNSIRISGDTSQSPYWSVDGQNGLDAGPGLIGDYPRDPCQLGQALGEGKGDHSVELGSFTWKGLAGVVGLQLHAYWPRTDVAVGLRAGPQDKFPADSIAAWVLIADGRSLPLTGRFRGGAPGSETVYLTFDNTAQAKLIAVVVQTGEDYYVYRVPPK